MQLYALNSVDSPGRLADKLYSSSDIAEVCNCAHIGQTDTVESIHSLSGVTRGGSPLMTPSRGGEVIR